MLWNLSCAACIRHKYWTFEAKMLVLQHDMTIAGTGPPEYITYETMQFPLHECRLSKSKRDKNARCINDDTSRSRYRLGCVATMPEAYTARSNGISQPCCTGSPELVSFLRVEVRLSFETKIRKWSPQVGL